MVPDPRSEEGRAERLKEVDYKEWKEIFKQFPKGNPSSTITALRFSVAYEVTFWGDPITYKMIMDGWKQYLIKCKNEDRETKYIKTMESFIKAKDFQNEEPEEIKESWLDKLKKGNQDDDYEL